MVCGLSPSLRGGGLPGPDYGGQSGSSSGCSCPGCFRVPTRTLKKPVFRGRDSAGPLTEATRIYLLSADTGAGWGQVPPGSMFIVPMQALVVKSRAVYNFMSSGGPGRRVGF